MNYVELIQRQAEQVFGNKANIWLTQPKSPSEVAHRWSSLRLKEGYEVVKVELEKLSHGLA